MRSRAIVALVSALGSVGLTLALAAPAAAATGAPYYISTFSSWWTHHKILATSNGTSTGTVEVRPHNLWNFGANFGVYLEP